MPTASYIAASARERRFYTGMALLLLAVVFYGFSRSFFLSPLYPDEPAAPEAFFYYHGAVYTAWCLLLILQPVLVTVGRTDLHRRVGAGGAVLAVVMVVLGIYGSLLAAARPGGFVGIPVPPLEFLAVPIGDLVVFSILIGLAVRWRRDAQMHKRLMLIGTLAISIAAIARWPIVLESSFIVGFFIQDLLLLPLVAWDLMTRGRIHPATLWGGGLLIVSQPLRLFVGGTQAWQDFGAWAVNIAA